MVPDKFNMVDMGGIDLIMMQGEAVPGLYDKLMDAISNCQYQCLYHWMFDSVLIPPTYVQLEDIDGEVYLNEGVSVTSDNVIHIYSVEPAPVEPEIIPLLAEENGVYNVPTGKDGFNPVTVDVPSYTPIIDSLSITENGTYTAPSGVDGYSPVTVNVPDIPAVVQALNVTQNGTYNPPSGIDGYAPVTVNVSGGVDPVDIFGSPSASTGIDFDITTDRAVYQGIAYNYYAFNEPDGNKVWGSSTAALPAWLRYDFINKSARIVFLQFKTIVSAFGGGFSGISFELQGSNDGFLTYDTIASVSNWNTNTAVGGSYVGSNSFYSSFRFYITQISGNYYPALNNIKAWGYFQ